MHNDNLTRRFFQLAIWALVLILPGISIFAASGDWPQWRGPNRDGISPETGLLKEWPQGGPPMVMKITGLGTGYSSVAVSNGKIVTMGDKGDASYVLAINVEDGKTIWSTKFGKSGSSGWGNFEGPRSTPTVDGGQIFAIGQFGELVCLDGASGKEIWRKDFKTDFGGERPEWGFSESPLVDGDKVVFTPGGPKGAVVALNRKTGALVWQSKEFTDAAHYASLIEAEIGGTRQYIQLTELSVAGIASANGHLLWRADRKGATAVIPTPIYHDHFVYVTSGYGVGCNLFEIGGGSGTFEVKQVYANKVMVNHHGGVIQIGDYVYGYSESKGWTCQEFKTGKVTWQDKEKLGKGSIAYADGHFYLREEANKGTVALIEASPEGYKEHGRFDQPERSEKNSWAHPVIASGRLYLRDQDLLLSYDLRAKK